MEDYLQISISDTDRFDKIVRQAQNIKSAIKNMNSRPRKGKEPENDGEGEEGDWVVLRHLNFSPQLVRCTQERAKAKIRFFGVFLAFFVCICQIRVNLDLGPFYMAESG